MSINSLSLCQLIREALSDRSKAAALALAIDQTPEIKVYLGKGLQPYYDEALPMTMRDVERNIQKFPQMYKLNMESVNCQDSSDAEVVRKYFHRWVKMILKCDCLDVQRRKMPRIISTSDSIGGVDGLRIEDTIDGRRTFNLDEEIPTLEGLDGLIAQEDLLENQKRAVLMMHLFLENIQNFSEKLTALLEGLSSCYPKDYPQANCYELIKRRLFITPPQKWHDLAKELEVNQGTVTAHWNRKCNPILTQIEKNLE